MDTTAGSHPRYRKTPLRGVRIRSSIAEVLGELGAWGTESVPLVACAPRFSMSHGGRGAALSGDEGAPGVGLGWYSSSMVRRGSTGSFGLVALCVFAQFAILSSNLWHFHSHGHGHGDSGDQRHSCGHQHGHEQGHEQGPVETPAPSDPSDQDSHCQICLAIASVTLDLPGVQPSIGLEAPASGIALELESQAFCASIGRPSARGPPAASV